MNHLDPGTARDAAEHMEEMGEGVALLRAHHARAKIDEACPPDVRPDARPKKKKKKPKIKARTDVTRGASGVPPPMRMMTKKTNPNAAEISARALNARGIYFRGLLSIRSKPPRE
jgi:hypothetical protein